MYKIAMLVSGSQGRGSTLQNMADACEDGRLPGACVVAVIGSVSGSTAIERAAARGLPTFVVSAKPAEDYDRRLLAAVKDAAPDAICLAGYMRILPDTVLAAYPGRILNIHPALLPAFGGKGMYGHHVHQAVIDYGVKVTGCTVHFVDPSYDNGPVILQKPVPVEDDDTPESVGARVLAAEHAAYPEAVRLLAEGRLRIEGRHVRILPRA